MSDERGAPCVSAPEDCWNTVSRDIQYTDSIQDTAAQHTTAACTSLLQDQQNLQEKDTPGHLQEPAKQEDSGPPEHITTLVALATAVVEQKGTKVTLGQFREKGKHIEGNTQHTKRDLDFQGPALDPQSPVVDSVGYSTPLTSPDVSLADTQTKRTAPAPEDTRTKGTRSPPSFQWTSCDLDTNLVFISSRETDHSDCTDTEDMVAKSDSFTDSDAEGKLIFKGTFKYFMSCNMSTGIRVDCLLA